MHGRLRKALREGLSWVEMHRGASGEGRSGPATTLSSIVFAYGATGAGKTHTMLGREGEPGIMYLTTMELYRRLEARQEEKRFEVLISYQEVRLFLPGTGWPHPSCLQALKNE